MYVYVCCIRMLYTYESMYIRMCMYTYVCKHTHTHTLSLIHEHTKTHTLRATGRKKAEMMHRAPNMRFSFHSGNPATAATAALRTATVLVRV